MSRKFNVIVRRDGDGYTAQGVELDIASQGKTDLEAARNALEAAELFFESASEQEIQERYHPETMILHLFVDLTNSWRK